MTPPVSLSPAVSGATTLWLASGPQAIESLVNQVVSAWDGQAFVEVKPVALAGPSDQVRLIFRNEDGQLSYLVVGEGHAFPVAGEAVPASDLRLGTRLAPIADPAGNILAWRLQSREILETSETLFGLVSASAGLLFGGIPSL